MKCGVEYDDNVDISLAINFLSDIFIDIIERKYALRALSYILEADNRKQNLTFNYGYTASNGKSYLMEKIMLMMGDYGDTFPVTVITDKMRKAGEANTTLNNFFNKRFLYCSEPENNTTLNVNMIKSLTGDIIKVRGLFKNERRIEPTYNIFVCCNRLPKFDNSDKGIERRIDIIEYKTVFCEKPKKFNERLLKKYTKKESEIIMKGIMKILIQEYKNIEISINNPFETIKNMYIDDNKDDIIDILSTNYQIGEDTDFIRIKDIKDLLKNNYGLSTDLISLKHIVISIFDDVIFHDRKKIDQIDHRNIFSNLKMI